MIDPLNEVLRDLVQSRVPALAGVTQVGFEPPNDDWAADVVAAGEERLNLYLYDVRENVKLRTNERTREQQGSWVIERPMPVRVDCHYSVTAWSPAAFVAGVLEPTRDEHLRLYEVLHALMRQRPLRAAEVYAPGIAIPSGRTLASVPVELQDEVPMEVAPKDGPRNQGDFWNTMRRPWRPALELVATVPLVPPDEAIEIPVVTTVSADYGFWESDAHVLTGSSERLLTIGGHILHGAPLAGVARAWVQLAGLDPDLQQVSRRTMTSPDGRFRFERLRPGNYRLRTSALGVGTAQRDVELPSPSGEYDLEVP